MKKNYVKIILICMLGVFLSNCEDGEIGPAGKDGIDGTDGTNGVDGGNGENGEGFDELAKYGNIQLTLTGKRQDDVAINNTSSFKFIATDPSMNIVTKQDEETRFNIARFISAPGDRFESAILFGITVSNPGEENQIISNMTLEIYNHHILAEDLGYFNFTQEYEIPLPMGDRKDISNLSISDYSFNEETNNLKLSFSFDVSGPNNPTGNDITIAGEIDAIVFNSIDANER